MENEISLLKYGAASETLIHPLVLFISLIGCVLILFLNRRNVVIPFLFMGILIPLSQKIVIADFDFMVLRIIILFTLVRIFIRHEHKSIKLNLIDKIFILYGICNVICFTLLWQTFGAFTNRMGFAINVFGIYFVCRFLVRDFEDIDRIIKTLVIICVLVATCMLVEQARGKNPMAFLGGVLEITNVRQDRLRSQGPFAHAILAGTFGATLMPLFISLWWQNRNGRKWAILGCLTSIIIVASSASSGPLVSLFAGTIGFFLWHFRNYMRLIKWGMLFSIIALHMIMEAPVWALIGRVGVIGGSSGYHRYIVVDQFIRRFHEWWLFGTKSTDHWGWMMWDTSNQYVSEGTRGGLITLLLFIVIILLCFRGVELMVGKMNKINNTSKLGQLRFWALGAALFAHLVAFIGIAYFDQMIVIWYMLLALIATITSLPAKAIFVGLQDSNEKRIIPILSSK